MIGSAEKRNKSDPCRRSDSTFDMRSSVRPSRSPRQESFRRDAFTANECGLGALQNRRLGLNIEISRLSCELAFGRWRGTRSSTAVFCAI